MKVLITGKKGQVGNCLVTQLSNMGTIDFWALGREELDITNFEQVNKVLSEYKPNVIVNAAAYTAVDKAETEFDLANAINHLGAENLAKGAAQINAVIIHISTDYVFSGEKDSFYNENDVANPQSVYGKTKLKGEQAVACACPAHIILRTSWVFSQKGNNFVKKMLQLAESKDSLNVVSDQFGAPTYAGDIANAIIVIAQKIIEGQKSFGIYHFSGRPKISWEKFAIKIFDAALKEKLIHRKIKINAISSEDFKTVAKRPLNSALDCQKIHDIFSIEQSDWNSELKNIKRYK